MRSSAEHQRPDGGKDPEPVCVTRSDGSRPGVLLAEDSNAARILTAALLRRMGCDVDAVEHGEEALARIQNFSYDVVLMDIEMPVMDGIVATQEIRSLGGAAGRTPIIALSAFMADAQQASLRQQSFSGFVAKPASREQLHSAISAIVNPAPVPESAPVSREAAAPVEPPVVDSAAMEKVKAQLQPEAWRELLETAIYEMKQFAQMIAIAQTSNDVAAIRDYTHKLQGVASTFAAPKLAGLAGSLELAVASPHETEVARQIADICACVDQTATALALQQSAQPG